MSCSTNARRSAGDSVSSTTSSATPTLSAISASCSGSPSPSSNRATTGSSDHSSTRSSRRLRRARSMSRQMRLTTVVSHPRMFSTSSRVGAAQPEPRLLHGVVGLAGRAQHPLRHRAQMTPVLLELLGLPLCRVHRSHPLVGLRQRGDEPDTEASRQIRRNCTCMRSKPKVCERRIRAASRPSRGSTSRSPKARSSACSAPTAPASRPRWGCSRRRSCPTAGIGRLAGYDVARLAAPGQERLERRLPGGGRRPQPERAREPRAAHPAVGRAAGPGQAADRRARGSAGPVRADRATGGELQRRRAPAPGDRSRALLGAAGAVPRRADRRARSRGSATSCST